MRTHWVCIVKWLKVQPGRSKHDAAWIAHKRSDPFGYKEKKAYNHDNFILTNYNQLVTFNLKLTFKPRKTNRTDYFSPALASQLYQHLLHLATIMADIRALRRNPLGN